MKVIEMNKIDEIIYNLNLIRTVIPDYAEGRNQSYSDEETEKIAYQAINQAIEILGTLSNNGDWIPASERLPSNSECNKFDEMHPHFRKFLCTIKIADYEPQTRILYLSEVFGWKYGADNYNKYVIAWKPLPEPYEEA